MKLEKPDMKRGIWSREEDAKIVAYVSKHGTGNWSEVSKKTGLKRCGKSCRLRWTNYLRPDLKPDTFSSQEEELIIKLHGTIGARWSIIAQQLPGRTDNDIKNYWNTKLKKKLSEMGIDPVTHKPFSQIIEDYGNIGGICSSGEKTGSFDRELKRDDLLHNTGKHSVLTERVKISQDQFANPALSSELASLNRHPNLDTRSRFDFCSSSQFMGNKSPSCIESNKKASSSSTCSIAIQENTACCNWRDYLIEDVFLPVDDQQQEPMIESLIFSNTWTGLAQNGPLHSQHSKPSSKLQNEQSEEREAEIDLQKRAHSSDSFIETILEKDKDAFLYFPSMSDEIFFE